MQAFAEWLRDTAPSLTLQTTNWMLPVIQSIHILAVGVVLASALLVTLRLVGLAAASQPVDAVVRRHAPWLWGSLIALGTTGLLMIVAEPVRELMSPVFWSKMALLVLGIAMTVYFLRHAGRQLVSGSVAVPSSVRTAALGTVALWCVIIFLGRWIAYGPSMAVY
jgi:hypothetical protein